MVRARPTSAEFDRFWAAFPKRPGDARHPASVEFAKLIKAGVAAEALVASAVAYADHVKRQSIAPQYLPMGKRWLAERRHEDFPASAPSAPSPEGPAGDPALDFLRAVLSAADFASWIARLRVEERAGRLTIIARTGTALERVRREWGGKITAQLGPVDWIVERSEDRAD